MNTNKSPDLDALMCAYHQAMSDNVQRFLKHFQALIFPWGAKLFCFFLMF